MFDLMRKKLRSLLSGMRGMRFTRSLFMTPRQQLGRKAEAATAAHLRADGYSILQRNYLRRGGEIDIIAFRGGTIAFVEVRSRTGESGPGPQESVDSSKQKKIASTARIYMAEHREAGKDCYLRFDVAAVTFDERRRITGIEYFEDAFRPD